MGKVLFVSALPLGRCKSMTRIYDAYDGPKEFRCGVWGMRSAERDGFSAVVCDSLPVCIEGKRDVVSINLGHGLTGGKKYALDEGDHPWVNREALSQIDYAIATSEAGVPIVARQLGISKDRVLPLGMARTDAYFEDSERRESFMGVPLEQMHVYLYCPTFRGLGDRGHLPAIVWNEVDRFLDDDELLVVKRHHLTPDKLTSGCDLKRVVELPFEESTEKLLRSCDVLATDYSSTMFDALMLGKPVVLLTDDMNEYLSARGMYYEYPYEYSSYGLNIEGNEDEFVGMLRFAAEFGLGFTERECLKMVAGACDGHSTDRICKFIKTAIGA